MIGRLAVYFSFTVLIRLAVESGSTLSILVIGKLLGQEAVATYSVCLAAIWLSSIVFNNGIPVLMRRNFIVHSELAPLTVYRRCLATVFRARRQYVTTGLLFAGLAVYIDFTIGANGVLLLAFMTPLSVILSILTIKLEYHRAVGETIRASIFEPGIIHLAVAVLIAAAVAAGMSDLLSIFSVAFIAFAVAAALSLAHVWRKTRGETSLRNLAAQRKILANNLLMFVFRNGFPLFFAAFIVAADLGHFRMEERLFFLLLFFYMLFETLGMKSIIAGFSGDDHSATVRFYIRSLAKFFAIGLVVAAAMYAALSNRTLVAFIGYFWTGQLTLFMALATPFYFATYFNNLVLNLLGHHGIVIWSMLAGAIAFIGGAYLLYPLLGIDGVRLAYFSGGLASAVLSTIAVLVSHRRAVEA